VEGSLVKKSKRNDNKKEWMEVQSQGVEEKTIKGRTRHVIERVERWAGRNGGTNQLKKRQFNVTTETPPYSNVEDKGWSTSYQYNKYHTLYF